jgi:hypothetical protein
LRKQGAVSSVRHFDRVFFYDWQCEFDHRGTRRFWKQKRGK